MRYRDAEYQLTRAYRLIEDSKVHVERVKNLLEPEVYQMIIHNLDTAETSISFGMTEMDQAHKRQELQGYAG